VSYYIEATGADNHAVREAACACIAELGSKVKGWDSEMAAFVRIYAEYQR
jgi:hypothetical protein